MEIKSIYDKSFQKYGKVIDYDFTDLINKAKLYKANTCEYSPSIDELESSSDKAILETYFGNMPIQIGLCYGVNKALNCLEYHKSSEVNIASSDCILLLGTIFDIDNNTYDTSLVEAFKLDAGVAVELYSTTLHYAPINSGNYFSTIIVLPKGTNYPLTNKTNDKLLTHTNKWLIAHPDSGEAKNGSYVGLKGENICL